jgi:hypothetical protein
VPNAHHSHAAIAASSLLVIFFVYFLLACVFMFPLPFHLTSSMIKNDFSGALPEGDVICFLWGFWWVKTALVDLHTTPLYTYYQAYPKGYSLLFTPLSLLNCVLSIPLQPFCSLTTIYNIYLIATLTLTAFFTFLLVRELGGDVYGAFLAGCIFSFSSFHLAQLYHLHIFSTQWIPLTLWLFIRMLNSKQKRYAIFAAMAFLANLFTSWYHMVSLLFLLALFSGYRIMQVRSETFRMKEKRLRPFFLAGVIFLFVALSFDIDAVLVFLVAIGIYLVIILYSQRQHPSLNSHITNCTLFIALIVLPILPYTVTLMREYGERVPFTERTVEAKIFYSADPLSYVLPTTAARFLNEKFQLFGSGFYALRTTGEFQNFPGCVVVGLLIITLAVLRRNMTARFWLVLAIVFLILSLGPVLKVNGIIRIGFLPRKIIVLPGILLHMLPVTEGIRVFSRFSGIVLFALAVFLGCNVRRLFETLRLAKPWCVVLTILIAVALFAERLAIPHPLVRIEVPPVYYQLAKVPREAVFMEVAAGDMSKFFYLQTIHGHCLVNAFSSETDTSTQKFYENYLLLRLLNPEESPDLLPFKLSEDLTGILLEDMAYLQISYFIVHKAGVAQKMLDFYHTLLGQYLRMSVCYEDQGIRIYGYEPLESTGER